MTAEVPRQQPSAARRKVVGVGWAKTGTTTLGRCFEILGLRHQGPDLDLVRDVAAGDHSRLLALAEQSDGLEDWPWSLAYRELDEAFPGSRFVLTLRDPARWLASYRNMLRTQGPAPAWLDGVRRLIYGLPFPDVTDEQLLARVARHNDDVRTYFRERPDDLLMVDWARGDGWDVLCPFLGVPVPDEPFPHENRGVYADG